MTQVARSEDRSAPRGREVRRKEELRKCAFQSFSHHTTFWGAGKDVGNGVAGPHLPDEVTGAQRGEVGRPQGHFSLLT